MTDNEKLIAKARHLAHKSIDLMFLAQERLRGIMVEGEPLELPPPLPDHRNASPEEMIVRSYLNAVEGSLDVLTDLLNRVQRPTTKEKRP